jgi:NADH-quinone oxidoreductase subunit J
MVLFLFVVMMLDINTDALRRGFWRHFPLAALIGTFIVLEMAWVLLGSFRVSEEPKAAVAAVGQAVQQASNTRDLGMLLYGQYLYPLEVAAVILLVAIIAAIALTLRERKDSRFVDASQQVRVRARDRLQILPVEPVRRAPGTPTTDPAAADSANGAKA